MIMIRKLLLISIILALPAVVFAVPLSGQYSITSSATTAGDNWDFTYAITNINQGSYEYFSGLGGLFIMIPEAGTLLNVSVPPPGFGAGFWSYEITDTPLTFLTDQVPSLPSGYTWLRFWGNEPRSTYWINTTATFTFTMSGVAPGVNPGVLVSFIPNISVPPEPGWYSVFDTNMLSPVAAVPEPAVAVLLGLGLMGLASLRRGSQG